MREFAKLEGLTKHPMPNLDNPRNGVYLTHLGETKTGSQNLHVGSLKGPTHDSNFQPQPQFSTATSTKFPVYGFQQPQPQPQLAGRGCGCCRSEFSDIWWAELKVAVEVGVVYGQKRSIMSHKHRYLHAFELVYSYK